MFRRTAHYRWFPFALSSLGFILEEQNENESSSRDSFFRALLLLFNSEDLIARLNDAYDGFDDDTNNNTMM